MQVQGTKLSIRAFASRKSMKKSKRMGQPRKSVSLQTKETLPEDGSVLADTSSLDGDNIDDGNNNVYSAPQDSISIPSRSNVLQACTITSGLIAALGLIIRQVCFRTPKITSFIFIILSFAFRPLFFSGLCP